MKHYEETAGELRITLFTDSVVSYPLSEIDSLGNAHPGRCHISVVENSSKVVVEFFKEGLNVFF